jgi:hypothetical protein
VQIRARNFLLVQIDQDVLLERLRRSKIVLALGAVAPENVLGLCQRRDLVYPIEHGLVAGFASPIPLGANMAGAEILHRTKLSILTMNLPSSRLQRHSVQGRIPKEMRYDKCEGISRFTCARTVSGIN